MNDVTRLVDAVKRNDLTQVRAILDDNKELVHQRDESGATVLHYATLNGHRELVRVLLDRGAAINSPDNTFGATPTGWAIEYLREQGGYLGIELGDLAYAIEIGDTRWVARFLKRFPGLRDETDTKGRSFRQLAQESHNREIIALFQPPEAVD